MTETRVIPILLLHNRGLYKTIKFQKPSYVGDPINTLKIFNEKEVHEIAVLDFKASKLGIVPDFEYLETITSECFMPLSYGGGITTLEQAKRLFSMGFEKVILNSVLLQNPQLITKIAETFGSQAVVVAADVKKGLFGGYSFMHKSGTLKTKRNLIDYLKELESRGAGEIICTSIDREGTYSGYDVELIHMVSSELSIPVVANGGASKIEDFKHAVQSGASALAASSLFVYYGEHRAVLINYPNTNDLKSYIK